MDLDALQGWNWRHSGSPQQSLHALTEPATNQPLSRIPVMCNLRKSMSVCEVERKARLLCVPSQKDTTRLRGEDDSKIVAALLSYEMKGHCQRRIEFCSFFNGAVDKGSVLLTTRLSTGRA